MLPSKKPPRVSFLTLRVNFTFNCQKVSSIWVHILKKSLSSIKLAEMKNILIGMSVLDEKGEAGLEPRIIIRFRKRGPLPKGQWNVWWTAQTHLTHHWTSHLLPTRLFLPQFSLCQLETALSFQPLRPETREAFLTHIFLPSPFIQLSGCPVHSAFKIQPQSINITRESILPSLLGNLGNLSIPTLTCRPLQSQIFKTWSQIMSLFSLLPMGNFAVAIPSPGCLSCFRNTQGGTLCSLRSFSNFIFSSSLLWPRVDWPQQS